MALAMAYAMYAMAVSKRNVSGNPARHSYVRGWCWIGGSKQFSDLACNFTQLLG